MSQSSKRKSYGHDWKKMMPRHYAYNKIEPEKQLDNIASLYNGDIEQFILNCMEKGI